MQNQQGNDAGFQYASFIFAADEEQERISRKVVDDLQNLIDNNKISSYSKSTVTTGIGKYSDFFEASEDHQEYLMKNPTGYWCVITITTTNSVLFAFICP